MLQFMHDDHAADVANFPGAKATYTETMNFMLPDSYDGIPVYRVMDRQGNVIDQSHDPRLSDDELLKMYKVRSQIFGFCSACSEARRMSKGDIGPEPGRRTSPGILSDTLPRLGDNHDDHFFVYHA